MMLTIVRIREREDRGKWEVLLLKVGPKIRGRREVGLKNKWEVGLVGGWPQKQMGGWPEN